MLLISCCATSLALAVRPVTRRGPAREPSAVEGAIDRSAVAALVFLLRPGDPPARAADRSRSRTRRCAAGSKRCAAAAGCATATSSSGARRTTWATPPSWASLPHVRYILLSDLLLERMDDEQIEAVFAHEVGHVVHRHMAWYVRLC